METEDLIKKLTQTSRIHDSLSQPFFYFIYLTYGKPGPHLYRHDQIN